MTRAIQGDGPLVIRTAHVALDADAAVELRLEQEAGCVSVGLYLARGPREALVPGAPLLRVPPRALRELARALDRFAGELGVRP